MPLTAEDRQRGGLTRAARRQSSKAIRVVAPDAVPGGKAPTTLDDCIAWSSWLAFASVTGLLDPASCREAIRSIGMLKDSINKADLLKRIRDLEREARALRTLTPSGTR